MLDATETLTITSHTLLMGQNLHYVDDIEFHADNGTQINGVGAFELDRGVTTFLGIVADGHLIPADALAAIFSTSDVVDAERHGADVIHDEIFRGLREAV